MTNIPIQAGTYNRQVAKEPYLALKNRFFETNPALSDTQVAAIARPGMRKFLEVGDGPIRGLFSQPGCFDDDLFALSGNDLYRVSSSTGSATFIASISSNPIGDVSWAAVANIGDTPARLFIAEGGVLWVYTDNGQSRGHLQATGTILNNDVVRIDNTYYRWTNASVDAGTPAGTAGNPWLVALGISNATALNNLFDAINAEGVPGTTYSTALVEHTTVFAAQVTSADLYVNARTAGAAGDAIVTTSTSVGAVWSAATLQNGGTSQITQVMVPDDNGAISVASINSYVIVVPVQDEDAGTIGMFYWIQPGETSIDPLDFATAERSPDKIHQVKVYGDMFWLLGTVTTEPWVTTGSATAPMQRFTGILFDRGSWEGTAIQVKDSLIVVDEDGGVFQIASGQNRISRPDIEERIRRAMQLQALSGA